MWQFYWNWFISAFSGAWAISQAITGAIALIAGIVVWKHPNWEVSMKNLIWMIPLGAFLILLIIRLIIAPFDIYQKQQMDIKNINDKLKHKENKLEETEKNLEDARKQIPPSITEIMTSQYIKDRDIFLASLGMIDPIIHDKVFDHCRIIGPVVMAAQDNTQMSHCRFEGDINSFFIATTNERIIGIMILKNCKFLYCDFKNISFIGSVEQIAKIKADLNLPSK
jgi:hypothetical protein